MQNKKIGSFNLFISATLAIFMLCLLSLPVFAGTSEPFSAYTYTTATSTIYSTSTENKSQSKLENLIQTMELSPTSSPSPTLSETGIFTITVTITPTHTPTFVMTNDPTQTSTTTPTSTSTPTHTITPSITPIEAFTSPAESIPHVITVSYLPVLLKNISYTPPLPLDTVLFCDSLGGPVRIPDNDNTGIYDYISIPDGRKLVNVSLYLDITHSWIGDLVVDITNEKTGNSVTLFDRPGNPSGSCSEDNITSILDDGAALFGDDKCASSPKAISGIYLPTAPLNVFSGQPASGIWRLNVTDLYQNDIGYLNHWCLETSLSDIMPTPTPLPTPVTLPASAYVPGMSGQSQQLNLDCESRSAVDWARHFNLVIDEFDFLYNLPFSDDPETGFVGNPDGTWGYIPPDDYGVHAPPIASLLRNYGLTASSYRSLRWDDIRAEIASGNPAIVWIIGDYSLNLVNGVPHFYTPSSTGNTTIVAPYEHTVIVYGYSPDTVNVLNGSHFINIPLSQFLDSWSALQFMGVLARP